MITGVVVDVLGGVLDEVVGVVVDVVVGGEPGLAVAVAGASSLHANPAAADVVVDIGVSNICAARIQGVMGLVARAASEAC